MIFSNSGRIAGSLIRLSVVLIVSEMFAMMRLLGGVTRHDRQTRDINILSSPSTPNPPSQGTQSGVFPME